MLAPTHLDVAGCRSCDEKLLCRVHGHTFDGRALFVCTEGMELLSRLPDVPDGYCTPLSSAYLLKMQLIFHVLSNGVPTSCILLLAKSRAEAPPDSWQGNAATRARLVDTSVSHMAKFLPSEEWPAVQKSEEQPP